MGIVSKVREWFLFRNVRREIAKDPWLHSVVEYATQVLSEPSLSDNPLVTYLHKNASPVLREQYATRISAELLSIAASNDRIVACRQWLFRVCEEYACLHVLMLSRTETTKEAAGEMYHPCVTGLYEALDDIILKDEDLHDLYRREGGIAEARESIRLRSLRGNLELQVADYARRQLGDYVESKKDWFIPLFNSMCALAEGDFRQTLGMPSICDTLAILEEQTLLQRNLLAGYKDPLEGVPFAGQDMAK